MMKRILALLFWFSLAVATAQSWPSANWSSAVNLTAVMDSGGITDLSGLHFNPTNNRLYGVQGTGRLRVLQWNTTTNSFSQLASKSISGGPEGITQANLYANEFYTIDENNYEIRRYTHTANFSTVTLYKHWNLLALPSPMQETGNTGPEGITFVPDAALSAIGFVSEQTGQPYTSVKGLGGLFFIAHQDQGYVWVFDVNPNANDDFAYVGKYKTSRSESCDLAFDRTTNLLYILHNIPEGNKLEVSDLSTLIVNGNERKFIVTDEYNLPAAGDGNENFEGFALTPKCTTSGNLSAWLCRDVETNEDLSIQQSVLKWFMPFAAPGDCPALAVDSFSWSQIKVTPNPAQNYIEINGDIEKASIRIVNVLGQVMIKQENAASGFRCEVSNLTPGLYVVEITDNGQRSTVKFLKN